MKRLVLLVAVAVVLASILGLYLFAYSNAPNIEGPSSGYRTYYYNNEET